MFGLIHFGVGISISFSAVFADAYRRRFTRYTLTDRRAFIATDIPFKGKMLESYPITKDSVFRIDKGRRVRVPIGFEQIKDGAEALHQAGKVLHSLRRQGLGYSLAATTGVFVQRPRGQTP